jgi:hypothetical protein
MEYAIVPYLVVQEAPTWWRLERNEKISIHVKRKTKNSEFFDTIEMAHGAVRGKINQAVLSINDSIGRICASDFIGLSYSSKLFIGKFKPENFTLKCFRVIGRTKSAWRIDTEEKRMQERRRRHSNIVYEVPVLKGRSYIYPYESQAHNPVKPGEKWISLDLKDIKLQMQMFAEDRIAYLQKCQRDNDEFVRLWKVVHE